MDPNNEAMLIPTVGAPSALKPTWTAAKIAMNDAFLVPVHLPDGSVLLVDEDGLSKKLSVNTLASIMAGQQLVGDVVLVPKKFVKKVLGA
jgi:hypothetical protein